MRGVLLAPGNHKIEFRYLPPLKPLYITLCALACAAVLAGFLIWDARRRKPDETTGGSLEM